MYGHFNANLQLSITNEGDGAIVGLAIVNTIIGGCGGGLSVLFLNRICFTKKWSYLWTVNGTLTGMVSMCAGCDVYRPWSSLLIGVVGGVMFIAFHQTMLK